MTVIAWDGKTLAADKRATNVGYKATVTKIAMAANGDLMAVSGDAAIGRSMMAWYEGKRADYPANKSGDSNCLSYLMVITKEKKILVFEREPYPMEIEATFHAMGSGRDYALAAMHLGHGAKKAVEVASALDCYCGNGIDTLVLSADYVATVEFTATLPFERVHGYQRYQPMSEREDLERKAPAQKSMRDWED